jgi:hypothetical protein
MSAPTTLTISYGASSTQALAIPTGITYDQAVKNIYLAGGFWFTSTAGVLTFVPWGEITSITAA